MTNITEEDFKELDKLAEQLVEWRRKHGVRISTFGIGVSQLLIMHEELKDQLEAEGIIKKALEGKD